MSLPNKHKMLRHCWNGVARCCNIVTILLQHSMPPMHKKDIITKRVKKYCKTRQLFYYKTHQFYYKMRQVLQNASFIRKRSIITFHKTKYWFYMGCFTEDISLSKWTNQKKKRKKNYSRLIIIDYYSLSTFTILIINSPKIDKPISEKRKAQKQISDWPYS